MSFDLAIIGGDLDLLQNGEIRTVSDTEKLRQDILKIILTPAGSNKYHPWYGCTVTDAIIGMNLPANIMDLDIKTSISESIERLRILQSQQLTTQSVSLAELINVIGKIEAYRAPEDFRQVKVDVSVFAKDLTEINEVFSVVL